MVSVRLNSARLVFFAALAFVLFGVVAANADAAYRILDYRLTPSNLQAGGHPNVNYKLKPDSGYADRTGGDDLKSVVMDFPAGLLGNPEAATSKCSSSSFNSDTCPLASRIGTIRTVLRFPTGSFMVLDGTVHVLSQVSPGSAATIGFILKPTNFFYRKIFLKTEATGVVTVRSGTDKDYGLTLTVDNIPRALTTILNTHVSTTVDEITVEVTGRAGTPTKNSDGTSTPKGPYFVYMPTRCGAAISRATAITYQGLEIAQTRSFTPTGCSSVPFSPTASYAISNNDAGQSTGVAATFTVPTAGAAIQHSHVKQIQADMPAGSRLDFPAIGNVPELCSEADLNLDECPAGSKIGVVSANVPFLPPTMTGDVYMLSRGLSVQFGYILRGGVGGSVKAPLKGDIFTVDVNNDGMADLVRAVTDFMPQVPWSSATINFTTPMLRNPSTCGAHEVKTKMTGWSGKGANLTANYPSLDCVDDEPPVVTITTPADGSVVTDPSIPIEFTAEDNVGVVACDFESGDSVNLEPGDNVIAVSCVDAADNIGTATVTVTYDASGTPPVVAITSPIDGSLTSMNQTNVAYTVDDGSTIPAGTTCSVNGSASTSTTTNPVPLLLGANTIAVTCANSFGSSTDTHVIYRGDGPMPVITSPANNTNTSAPSINVQYSIGGSTTFPPATVCTINGVASSSMTTNSVALAMGANTIVLVCTNSFGSQTSSIVVNRGNAPIVAIVQPTGGIPVPPGMINVRYTVNGASTIPAGTTCTVNGQPSTDPNNNPVSVSAGANTITVVCVNVFGSGSATLLINILPPPTVFITSPANGSSTAGSSTNVVFTVNGSSAIPAGTACTVNGAPTTSTTTNTVALVQGANTITVACTNATGTGTASVTVTRVTSLFVDIVSPPNNSWTTAASLSPTLNLSGGVGTTTCSWRNNGTPTSPPIPLANGVNLIRVDCTNGSELAYDEITVRRDNIAPSVSVNVQGAVTIPENPPAAIISWTVTDDQDPTPANNCVVSVNGSVLPGAPHTSPVTFFPSSGSNSVSVQCLDEAGNVGTGTYSYTLPGGPFTLIITAPPNGAVLSTSTVNVTYAINGGTSLPVGMACQINGQSSSGGNSNVVPLSIGTNTITVSCIAQDGTVGSASVTVQRISTPNVTITAPANGTTTSNGSINVAYLVNGGASIPAGHNCTVNGNASTSTSTNTVPLSLGTNTITVNCTNAAGTGSATVSVTRMNLPTITGITPSTGSTVTTSPVNLSFLVNGGPTIPAGVTCTVNGVSTTSATTNSVSLSVGSNTVTIACSNAAGTTSVPVTLLYAPTIDVQIVSPTEGAWLGSGSLSPTLSITSPGGSVPGGITCSWTRNGTPVPSPLQLVEGANALVVTCTNGIVTDSDSVNVRFDPNPPTVNVTASVNSGTGPNWTATVSWTVADDQDPTPANNCTLSQDGTPIPSAPHTSPRTVTITGGSDVFNVTCLDEAGNSASDSDVVTVANPPTVEITAPLDGSSTTSGSTNVTFLVNGSAAIPPSTTCSVNGNQTTSTTTNNVALSFGSNTITVACTGVGGTGTDTATINRVSAPVVTILSPMNGQTVATSSVSLQFTVNGLSTIPVGTTCTVASSPVSSTVVTVPLAVGPNTIVVTCTNGAGTGTAAVSVTRVGDPPNTSVTAFAAPSASTARTETVNFAGTGADSFECRVNNGSWTACTSPWTLPLSSAEFTQGENQYSVRAVNSAGPDQTPVTGYIWVDDRPYNATASVAAEPNDLVATADAANDAGAHPDISASLTLEGYDDPRNVSVKFPDGLMGSLRAIPSADRCSLSQANAGNCPASAQIGVATATAQSSTDGQVTASGTLYLVAPSGLDAAYVAGVAAEFDTISGPISGDLGDVRAVGGLRLTDQARNITVELTDIPRETTTGNRFHLLSGNLTVFGDAGPDDTKPLITNPHFCNDDGEIFDARPNLKQFVGSGVGWNDEATSEITVDYIIDNCSSLLYEPSLDVSLSNPVAGGSTGLSATMSVPDGHGTLRSLQVRLPSYVALNFPSFGVASDMCSGSDDGSGAANDNSPPGTTPSYYSFDSSTCPPQSRVGTATLTTPLLDQPVTAYVYLIDKAPVPWLGLEVDPSIPGNPQGVKIGIVAFNSTPQEDPGCTSGCQQVVQSTFPSLPDVPLSSVELEIGGIGGRISDGPGNPTLNPNILNIASANSNTCRNSGTFANASFVPWSTTTAGTLTDPVQISGCNDPKINITSPVAPSNGSRINNVANTTTTSPLNFTINGGTTIPAGVSCDINGTPTSTTSNTVSLATGVNTFNITCSDAFGSGTATRRIDRGVPSVRFATPTASTTTASTASVTLGVHANGALLSGALPGTSGTTCNVNGTNVSSLSTAVIIPLVVGSNTLTATCTNSFGTGTAVFNITRN